jgi:hypothetical protein
VEAGCGVEPGPEPDLLVADVCGEKVCVDGVGLAGDVAEELEVNLIVLVSYAGCLKNSTNNNVPRIYCYY